MKKVVKLSMVISCVIALLSCNKQASDSINLVYKNAGLQIYKDDSKNINEQLYMNYYNNKDAYIYFSSINSAILYQSNKNAAIMLSSFTGKNNPKKGTLHCNEMSFAGALQKSNIYDVGFTESEMNNARAYFGNNVKLSIVDNSNTIVSYQNYCPKIIGIEEPLISSNASSQPICNKSVGINYKWNVDNSNSNGIAIVIRDDMDKSVDNVVVLTADDGEYYIAPEVLSGFKINHQLTVTIVRANGSIITGSDNLNYNIITYSECFSGLILH